MALAELHRAVALGGAVHLQLTSDRNQTNADDRFPNRHFTWWQADRLRDVVEGAGLVVDDFVDDGEEWIDVEATRARMLPDTVGPSMRVLIVGLNPSLLSADTGIGFARPPRTQCGCENGCRRINRLLPGVNTNPREPASPVGASVRA